jgi:hypothetical protein
MACVIGQNPSAQVAAEPEPSAARLEFIKAVAGRYKIYVGQDPRRRLLVLRETPVLRFGDDVTGVSDGAVFIWTDWVQRPPHLFVRIRLRTGRDKKAIIFSNFSGNPSRPTRQPPAKPYKRCRDEREVSKSRAILAEGTSLREQ